MILRVKAGVKVEEGTDVFADDIFQADDSVETEQLLRDRRRRNTDKRNETVEVSRAAIELEPAVADPGAEMDFAAEKKTMRILEAKMKGVLLLKVRAEEALK